VVSPPQLPLESHREPSYQRAAKLSNGNRPRSRE